MSENILCTESTRDGLAEAFATLIAKKYKDHLEFWQATAMDDAEEQSLWRARIKYEPDMVKKRVKQRIEFIMEKPLENCRFYRKIWGIFVDWNTIRIVPSSGFYQDLIPRDITNAFSANVEYRISKKDMNVIKIVHSQNTKL